MKASMLIAIADNGDQKDPTSKDILRKAFDEAKVVGGDRGVQGREPRLDTAGFAEPQCGSGRERLGAQACAVQEGAGVEHRPQYSAPMSRSAYGLL
jgi:hypothetical protein